jgi:hypothetical protein
LQQRLVALLSPGQEPLLMDVTATTLFPSLFAAWSALQPVCRPETP